MRPERGTPALGVWALLIIPLAVLGPGRALADWATEVTDKEVNELDALSLDDLLHMKVVTASGVEEDIALASANVTVITRGEIQAQGWQSVAEALSNVPGLYVIDDLVQPSVGVRGVSPGLRGGTRIVRVMINSVEVNFRPDLHAFIGLEYIPIAAIERIEVAKGPLSALYGPNAFLATVNIITRSSADAKDTSFSGTAHLGGQRGYGFSGIALHGTSRAGALISFTTAHVDRSGVGVQKTFKEQNPDLSLYAPFFDGRSTNDLSRPTGIYSQWFYEHDKLGTFRLQGGFQHRDASGEFQLNSVLTHQSRHSVNNSWAHLQHEKAWTDHLSSTAQFGLSQGNPTADDVQWLTNNSLYSYQRNFGYQSLSAGLEFRLTPLEHLALQAGGDFVREIDDVLFYTQTFVVGEGARAAGDSVELISENQPRKVGMNRQGAYLQVVTDPFARLPGLKFTGNLRLDWMSFFPTQSSWRVGVAYKFSDDYSAKLIVGRAYQVPSPVLLFGLPGFGVTNNVVGNRNLSTLTSNASRLNPQYVSSAELILRGSLAKRLGFELAAFAQELGDKIEFVKVGGNFTAQNRGQLRNLGFEVTSQATLGRWTPFLNGSAYWTLVDGQLSNVSPELFPNMMGVAGTKLDVTELGFSAHGQVRAVGQRGGSQSNVFLNNSNVYTLPAYVTVDVALKSQELKWLKSGGAFVSVAVRNLLNQRYSEPGFGGIDFPNLGRTFALELTQSFQ